MASRSRRWLLAAIAVLASRLVAAGESESRVFVSVHVLGDGSYKVNDKPVGRAKLEEELSNYKPERGGFDIRFQVAPSARYEHVAHALSVAQRLGASVGMFGNEKF